MFRRLSLAVLAGLTLLTVAGMLWGGGVSGSSPASNSPAIVIGQAVDQTVLHAETYVLVKAAASAAALAAAVGQVEPVFGDWYRVPVGANESPAEAMTRLAARPEVATVELDYLIEAEPDDGIMATTAGVGATAADFSPNDPLYNRQWNFAAIQMPQAWDISTGRGATIAIVDSGVARGTDLACRTFVSDYNAITDASGAGVAFDDFGHGTHLAGVVAECTNNGEGVAGIAYDAALMPIKVLDSQGNGSYATAARGVDWARAHGASVILIGFGGRAANSILRDAILAAAAEDIVVVAPAGNNDTGVYFPANMAETIAVAAVDAVSARAPIPIKVMPWT